MTMFDKLITDRFKSTVDDLILASENDANFKEVIKWVDMQSANNGISFYEMVYVITNKQLIQKKAEQFKKMIKRQNEK